MKNVDYLRVKDINFTSAKKMKCDLDKTVNSLDPALCTTTDTSKVTLESSSVSKKAHKPKAPVS